ncbi:MAG: hypothetical protein LBO00_00880 [Zoogloeaceae bacterium]|jgi:hypothetical protein|nr:hypothetical protein [Zoogloeaceae bacterium]
MKDELAQRAIDIVHDIEEEIGEFLADVERGHYDNDDGLTEDTAEEFAVVLKAFLVEARAVEKGDTEAVLSAIKSTVLALNALEEQYGKLDNDMIFCDDEEDGVTRGEKVRELIRLAAAEVGVGDGEKDLTEEWREKW